MLPVVLDVQRVLADQVLCDLVDGVGRTGTVYIDGEDIVAEIDNDPISFRNSVIRSNSNTGDITNALSQSAEINQTLEITNDIVIEEASVSRKHAQLRRRYGQYVIYDLGSSGGTSVNGHAVREAPLDDGDVVSLGGVELRFERLTGSPLPTQD